MEPIQIKWLKEKLKYQIDKNTINCQKWDKYSKYHLTLPLVAHPNAEMVYSEAPHAFLHGLRRSPTNGTDPQWLAWGTSCPDRSFAISVGGWWALPTSSIGTIRLTR